MGPEGVRRAVAIPAVLLACGLCDRPQASPTEVRQGSAQQGPAGGRIFTSPMIVETDLSAARIENMGKWLSTAEFEAYLCDGVRLRKLETRVKAKRRDVVLEVRVGTYTEPGHDKKVRVEIEVLDPDGVVGAATILSIDAEERKAGSGYAKLWIPTERWPSEAVPRLRLTVYAVDD